MGTNISKGYLQAGNKGGSTGADQIKELKEIYESQQSIEAGQSNLTEADRDKNIEKNSWKHFSYACSVMSEQRITQHLHVAEDLTNLFKDGTNSICSLLETWKGNTEDVNGSEFGDKVIRLCEILGEMQTNDPINFWTSGMNKETFNMLIPLEKGSTKLKRKLNRIHFTMARYAGALNRNLVHYSSLLDEPTWVTVYEDIIQDTMEFYDEISIELEDRVNKPKRNPLIFRFRSVGLYIIQFLLSIFNYIKRKFLKKKLKITKKLEPISLPCFHTTECHLKLPILIAEDDSITCSEIPRKSNEEVKLDADVEKKLTKIVSLVSPKILRPDIISKLMKKDNSVLSNRIGSKFKMVEEDFIEKQCKAFQAMEKIINLSETSLTKQEITELANGFMSNTQYESFSSKIPDHYVNYQPHTTGLEKPDLSVHELWRSDPGQVFPKSNPAEGCCLASQHSFLHQELINTITNMGLVTHITTVKIRELETSWLAPKILVFQGSQINDLGELVDFLCSSCDLLSNTMFSEQLYPDEKFNVIRSLDPVIKEATSFIVAIKELIQVVGNDVKYLQELITHYPKTDPVVYELSTNSATLKHIEESSESEAEPNFTITDSISEFMPDTAAAFSEKPLTSCNTTS